MEQDVVNKEMLNEQYNEALSIKFLLKKIDNIENCIEGDSDELGRQLHEACMIPAFNSTFREFLEISRNTLIKRFNAL